MIEQAIEISTPDGTSDGFLFRPDDQPHPGVIHLTDIWGIRDPQKEMCRRLAARGYTVLLPNVFYRSGRPPIFPEGARFGEPATMKRFGEVTGAMTPEAVARDAGPYVDFLLGQDSVSGDQVAVVGHCFTGAVALRIAAAQADKVALAASFHGGRLYTDDATSPHLVLPQVRARLYFGHADQDGSMPAEAIARLEQALAEWGGRYESELYDGALHGWTTLQSERYHPEQAARAFSKLESLLAETVGS